MITWTDDGSGQQGSAQEATAEVSNETAQADTDPAAAECSYEPDEPGQVHIDFVAETYAESEAEGEAVSSGPTDQAGAVPEDTGLDEIKDYDYSTLRDILKQNVAENAASVKEEASGSILLAGTAGFLGIHVLKAFLDSQEGKVYALVRRGNYASPQRRLMNLLMYYFDNPCDEYFGERIVCIEADIAEEKSLEKLKRYPFRTVINCTAGDGQPADGGTENLIAFCREMGRRLVQVSTVSVAGTGTGELPGPDRLLAENELYIGQQLADEALRSKFLAERSVLEAAESGLDAKVIRVGNVAGRASDGEFQINFAENGFLRRVRAYAAVGMFPESMVNERVELSPVDSTAAAILRLAGTDKRFTVYHACNSNRISKGDFVHAMNNHGFDIQIVNDAEFVQALAAHEDSGLTAVPAAGAPEGGEESYTVGYENRFTTEVLQKLGYQWPETDGCYLEKVIDALDRLGFFEFE